MTIPLAELPAERMPGFLHLRRPSDALMRATAKLARRRPFSYADVGATLDAPPDGWRVGRHAVDLPTRDWEAAKAAIRDWRLFDMDWVERLDDGEAPHVGQPVVFASRQLGLWALNACRVVAVVDEEDRFGFVYGTLDLHGVRGEERFLVLRDPDGGAVSFEVFKFSRLHHPAVRLVAPVAHALQDRFSVDAGRAMQRALR